MCAALVGCLAATIGCGPPHAVERQPGVAPGTPPGTGGRTPASGLGDAAPAPSDFGIPSDAGTAEAAAPLVIRAVTLPAQAVDVVPLRVTVAGPAGPVELRVEVSLDGQSYRPAHLAGAPGPHPVTPAGVDVELAWRSLADLGFHEPRAAKLRVTAIGAGATSAPVVVDTPVIDNLRAAARQVESYLIHYADWDAAAIALARRHDLVILHPSARNLPRSVVADIQRGLDPNDPGDDVIVLCYVSIGEDPRSFGITDAAARVDPRFRGDGTGPRIDPRGAAGGALGAVDARGLPSNGGTGWASYYLDDNSVFRSPEKRGDGIPDRNGEFGVFYVNAGDPHWFDVVDDNLLDSPDRTAGLRELLGRDRGRGFGCDGVFMDTFDTAAPNHFSADDLSMAKFEWTAAGMSRFVARVRAAYPRHVILQNRGLFYFDPRLPHFQVTTRGSIDLAFFESYRLGSRPTPPTFHLDNRYNVAPKLMAEANRPDGFTVLSLGYAEGTGLPGAVNTLAGAGNTALDSLLEDIRVTEQLAGFRHYLTNANLSLINSFVRDHSQRDDRAPPQWTSTYNPLPFDPQRGPQEPPARVGIQEVVPGSKSLTVRWDVALDRNRVGYALYYQDRPFDFAADAKLTGATRVVLSSRMPASYARGVAADSYPYEFTLSGLTPGTRYHLVIRAFDASPAGNEDPNQVVLTGVPAM